MRKILVAAMLTGCTPPPTPQPAAREPVTASKPLAPETPIVRVPAPSFVWLSYPPAACLGPVPTNPKHPQPAGPAISCAQATAQRETWLAAMATAATAPTHFPSTLPADAARLDTLLIVSPDDLRTTLVTRGPAGLLRVELSASGSIERAMHGAIEPTISTSTTALIVAVSLPAQLAPREFRVYDVIGATGQVEARITGSVSVQWDVARAFSPVVIDQAAIDAWITGHLPPSRSPTLALADGQSAIHDPTQSRWRVWTQPSTDEIVDDPGKALPLGGAGVAFVAAPTRQGCHARWFGPTDEAGQVVCKIVALPGGGARFTRLVPTGLQIVDIDSHGAERPRLVLPRATALAVTPVASPAQDIAWTHQGTLTVQDAAGRRVTKKGLPTCPAADHCAVTYARIVGSGGVLLEERRGGDHMHTHIAGLAGTDLAGSECDIVTIDHTDTGSEALLECPDGWALRQWGVEDGGETEVRPTPARVAGRRLRSAPAGVFEVAGERICAVDGWLHQGSACTGLQRYDAKSGVYEPAP